MNLRDAAYAVLEGIDAFEHATRPQPRTRADLLFWARQRPGRSTHSAYALVHGDETDVAAIAALVRALDGGGLVG